MEHCITRFFEECDPNKDKHITLKEWGHCFDHLAYCAPAIMDTCPFFLLPINVGRIGDCIIQGWPTKIDSPRAILFLQ